LPRIQTTKYTKHTKGDGFYRSERREQRRGETAETVQILRASSHTPLKEGVNKTQEPLFSPFPPVNTRKRDGFNRSERREQRRGETAETVQILRASPHTPLKEGVNET